MYAYLYEKKLNTPEEQTAPLPYAPPFSLQYKPVMDPVGNKLKGFHELSLVDIYQHLIKWYENFI
jgi:hypothetical protein